MQDHQYIVLYERVFKHSRWINIGNSSKIREVVNVDNPEDVYRFSAGTELDGFDSLDDARKSIPVRRAELDRTNRKIAEELETTNKGFIVKWNPQAENEWPNPAGAFEIIDNLGREYQTEMPYGARWIIDRILHKTENFS